jgi:MoxR-like ATPase
MVSANLFADHNAPFYIAVQARVPCLAEGLPGTGKSTILAALAAALGRNFRAMYGTQCTPEDVSGMPVPDMVRRLTALLPMAWVEALLTPGGFLFFDEITAVSPSVRAALLTVLTERRVGDLTLDIDTLMAAACNPSDLCPNGTPLELACNNRFFHHPWKTPRDAWLDGLIDLEWEAPQFPVVPADWHTRIPHWGARIQAFHRKSEGMENVPPKDDVQKSYPSERTWANAIRCLAAADAAGADMTSHQQFVRLMVAGNVGDVAANQFCTYNAACDLVDPVELLDGKAKFAHKESRPDLTFCVCASVVSTLLSASTFSEDRWNRGAALLGSIGTEVAPEVALKYTRLLHKAAADRKYAPPAKALKPLLELAAAMKS